VTPCLCGERLLSAPEGSRILATLSS
jgi:hypothetical protein